MSAQYCCFEPLEGICCQISPLKGALLEQISEGSADRIIMTNESLIITCKAQKSPQLLDSSWGWPIQHGLYFGEVCGHPLVVDNVPQNTRLFSGQTCVYQLQQNAFASVATLTPSGASGFLVCRCTLVYHRRIQAHTFEVFLKNLIHQCLKASRCVSKAKRHNFELI